MEQDHTKDDAGQRLQQGEYGRIGIAYTANTGLEQNASHDGGQHSYAYRISPSGGSQRQCQLAHRESYHGTQCRTGDRYDGHQLIERHRSGGFLLQYKYVGCIENTGQKRQNQSHRIAAAAAQIHQHHGAHHTEDHTDDANQTGLLVTEDGVKEHHVQGIHKMERGGNTGGDIGVGRIQKQRASEEQSAKDYAGAHLTAGRDGFASGKVPKEQKHRDRQKRPQKRHIDAIVAALIRDGGQNRREAENHGGQKDENNAGELILFHIRDQPL